MTAEAKKWIYKACFYWTKFDDEKKSYILKVTMFSFSFLSMHTYIALS